MALAYPITIDKGATYVKQLTWFNPAPIPNPNKLTHGDPKDLTGYTGEMMIRIDYDDATPQVVLNSQNGGITIVGGTINIRIEASATEAFTFDSGIYDLKLTAPDGTATRLVEGKVKVNPDVTRA